MEHVSIKMIAESMAFGKLTTLFRESTKIRVEEDRQATNQTDQRGKLLLT